MLVRDGGVIADGVDAELDELRSIARDSKSILLEIEARERERTGISSLKIRFNSVFGYYIEVSKSNLAKVPEDYIRKQTLANAERYITPDLKELEEKILGAEEKSIAIELRLYDELLAAVAHVSPADSGDGPRGRRDRRPRVARHGRRAQPLRPRRCSARTPRSASRTDAIRSSSSSPPSASSPTTPTRAATRTASRSSPARTWAASRPTCARWR